MSVVGRIAKGGHNDAQNYDFVTDADVLDAVRKALVDQNIATIASIGSVETVPFVTANQKPQFLVTVRGDIAFIDGDTGETFSAMGVGQGADSSDKGVYKAITGMVKYALLKTLLIPTGDDPERDDEPRPTKSSDAEGVPPSPSRVGLTDKQRAMLKARMREAGLEGQQQVAFAFETAGVGSSRQMDSAKLDRVLKALKDKELVARVIADVRPEKPA